MADEARARVMMNGGSETLHRFPLGVSIEVGQSEGKECVGRRGGPERGERARRATVVDELRGPSLPQLPVSSAGLGRRLDVLRRHADEHQQACRCHQAHAAAEGHHVTQQKMI